MGNTTPRPPPSGRGQAENTPADDVPDVQESEVHVQMSNTTYIDTELGPIVAINSHKHGAQIRVTFNDVIINTKETEKIIDALVDTLPLANLKRLSQIIQSTILRYGES